jgi:hypothetical protein
MCYIEGVNPMKKKTPHRRELPLLGSIIFRGTGPKVWIEGVKSTREQWQENRVINRRRALPA